VEARTQARRLGVIFTACLIGVMAPPAHASSPATSPGRNGRIAFARYVQQKKFLSAIFTANPDGSHVQQLTHPPAGREDSAPVWSHDGSMLAFVRFHPNSPQPDFCFTIHADGSQLKNVSGNMTKVLGCE